MVGGIRVGRDIPDVFQINGMDLVLDSINRVFDRDFGPVKGDCNIKTRREV